MQTHGGYGDAGVMQFPSEFEWISPSGARAAHRYMPTHYCAGWWMDSAPTLAEAEAAVLRPVPGAEAGRRDPQRAAPGRHRLLPPNKWVTEIHRDWNARYVWPRFVCAVPRDFFAAVRAELAAERPARRRRRPAT